MEDYTFLLSFLVLFLDSLVFAEPHSTYLVSLKNSADLEKKKEQFLSEETE
ncbi:hypothetical protein ISN44_As08g029630 [Arabidopsis suecica]|uniref:Uncharacterized protein n=1 Tax=Arabidopsis suecica TaxID=45249 RepID=A0A8T1XVX9_ARASU|nr:hypothetical protein ISN44_As13g027670 [Arabidopsis suecica]KAG7539087.1 hypothetical protein ISN44_As13g027680 [Arabidopsis suecica]KAG7539255.1 hypothetical protein ISN44_As13g029220 [Arabidopsis suecica]KAG7565195.1 hypothetical protein ISN44_As10g019080 [Arabidopsis suecica]KAG7583452.1 hypothetical protein ISN44_As08g029630 [Arabidopsis suecica]